MTSRARIARACLTAAVGLIAAAGSASPAAAFEDHASCRAFGQGQSQIAKDERPFGHLASNAAQAGFMSELIEETHTTEGLCEPR